MLVNNAGTGMLERKETADGFEWQFGVNHLAPFLLTNLLLDLLKKSSAARIVNVASMAYQRARLDFDDLQAARKNFNGLAGYGASKLANILFTLELARRLEGSNVTANCLHPGVVATNIFRNLGTLGKVFTFIGRPFMLSATKGAETSIYLASSPDVAKLPAARVVVNARKPQSAKTSTSSTGREPVPAAPDAAPRGVPCSPTAVTRSVGR